MKIAITGGAGFIGSRLAKKLKSQGHDITILDLNAPTPIDITDKQATINALANIDVIYHLAAEHRDDVRPIQKYNDVNIGGAENIIAGAKAHNIKTIIFTSTVAVYGLDAGESKETSAPNPFNPYGQSKWESEKLFKNWATENDKRTLTTLRLVATFGPGNRGNIYNLMNQIAQKKFIMIGKGQNKKSIAYVENVADFLTHCLNLKPGTHLYNYADKPDLPMHKMVEIIRAQMNLRNTRLKIPYIIGLCAGSLFDIAARLTGKTFPISRIRIQKFCADTIVNTDKIKETGFKPAHSLEDGLRTMIKTEFKS